MISDCRQIQKILDLSTFCHPETNLFLNHQKISTTCHPDTFCTYKAFAR